MRSERKLIPDEKAMLNQTNSRMRLMENGGSLEDWNRMLDAQVKAFISNRPSDINISPRWGLVSENRFLVTPEKAWENIKRKDGLMEINDHTH
jgi:hypothetical protein